MPISSIADLLRVLTRLPLLEPAHQAELPGVAARFGEAKALAQELLARGWLTAFQANLLFQGREAELLREPYVLLERLGEGGMGQVFRARHHKLGRIVALKVMRPERLAGAGMVRRFHREIQAAAQLAHPNVVLAFDAGEVNGVHYFAMEYVAGLDLARLVQRHGALPIEQACGLIRQAALGLQHAHERGLVHRDIKPANLLLANQTGTLKILDMGLARLCQEVHGEASSQLTQEGTVVGTPDFMAPEQTLDAHLVDIRADLYSLGCTLYYLLTAQVPFPGGSLGQKLMRHQLREPAPVESLRPEVPVEVAAIVRTLLAKQPAERFQTPIELANALSGVWATAAGPGQLSDPGLPSPQASRTDHLPAAPTGQTSGTAINWSSVVDQSQQAAPSSSRTRPRLATLLLTAGLVAAAGLVLLGVMLGLGGRPDPEKPTPPEVKKSPLDLLDEIGIPATERLKGQPEELTVVLGQHRQRSWEAVLAVAFGPEGGVIACDETNTVRHYNASLEQELQTKRGPNRRPRVIALSPDGRRALSNDSNSNHADCWDLETGASLSVAGGDKTSALLFCAGGKQALIATPSDITWWNLETKARLGRCEGTLGWINALLFFPERKQALSAGHDGTLRLWDLIAGQEVCRFDGQQGIIYSLAPLPDGKGFLSGGKDGKVRRWDLETRRERGCFEGHESEVGCLAVFRDGRRFLSGGYDSTLRLWELGRKEEVRCFRGHILGVQSVALSADETRAVSGSADHSIRLWDLAAGKEVLPLGDTGPACCLAFSPSGRQLLVGGGMNGFLESWDLSRGPEQLPAPGRLGERLFYGYGGVAISPDGRYAASGGFGQYLRLWDLLTSLQIQKLSPAATCAAWSADGKLLLAGATDGRLHLWKVPADLARGPWPPPRSAPGNGPVNAVAFALDGKGVAGADSKGIVWTGRTDTDSLTLQPWLQSFPFLAFQGLAISPDGKTLACGGAAKKVYLGEWGAAPGTPGELNGPPLQAACTSVAFSPDGKRLVVADQSGRLNLWDAETRRHQRTISLPGPIRAAVFAPDSRHIATANGNGTVYLLRLDRAD